MTEQDTEYDGFIARPCMLNGYDGLCENCPDKDNKDMVCNQEIE